MRKLFLLVIILVLITQSVAYGEEAVSFKPYMKGSYIWNNNYTYIGDFRVWDRGDRTFRITHKSGEIFEYKTCSTCIVQSASHFDFYEWDYDIIYMALDLYEQDGDGTNPTPDPEPPPTEPPNNGGGTVGATLPSINLMDDPEFSGTLWNYLGSVFTLGMPFLLIAVALIVVGYVLELLIEAVKHARKDDSEDYDDDDW